MMKKYDQSVEINHNPNWLWIPDHAYKILTIVDSGSGKTNVLLNLIKNQQSDTSPSYLYVKNPVVLKYQLLIIRREKAGIENLKNPNAFIDYSQKIYDIYQNLEN